MRIAVRHAKPVTARWKPKRRACLRCDQPFLSEGPHHRLCERCRQALAAMPTPEEVYSLGHL